MATGIDAMVFEEEERMSAERAGLALRARRRRQRRQPVLRSSIALKAIEGPRGKGPGEWMRLARGKARGVKCVAEASSRRDERSERLCEVLASHLARRIKRNGIIIHVCLALGVVCP